MCYGHLVNLLMAGPWAPGVPFQGLWQSPWSPVMGV